MTFPPYGPIPMSNDLCGNNDGITIPSLYGVVEAEGARERAIRGLRSAITQIDEMLSK